MVIVSLSMALATNSGWHWQMVLVWELLKLVWGSLSLKMRLALFFQKMCGGSVRPRPPRRRERSPVSPQVIRSHFDVVVRVDAEVRLCTGCHTPHTSWAVKELAKASIPHLVHGSEVSLPRPSPPLHPLNMRPRPPHIRHGDQEVATNARKTQQKA